MECLPYIDEHVISVDANRADTWSALLMLWCKDRDEPRNAPTVRPPFFSLDETVPMHRFALTGRHLFAVYKLVFELDDLDGLDDLAPARTHLSARSWAEFPGVHGKVYRALVIGTPLHRIAVRRLLNHIAADARARGAEA
jgi:hypothetical protein